MKLDPKFQQEMADADQGERGEGYEPLPDGYYLCKVKSINLSNKPGQSGFHQWVVVWAVVAPRKFAKRTVWDRLSLSPAAAWKMRQLFDALGYSYDSDSTELIGESAILEVFQAPIESGSRKGEMSENIESMHPSDEPAYVALVG